MEQLGIIKSVFANVDPCEAGSGRGPAAAILSRGDSGSDSAPGLGPLDLDRLVLDWQ